MLIIPFVLNLVNLKVTEDLKYWVYILTLLARLSTKDFYPIIVMKVQPGSPLMHSN